MNRSLIFFLLLLVTEVAIAVFHFHKFIRGFMGDILVIPLLFYFFRICINWKTWVLIVRILCLAITIELLQWLDLTVLFHIESIWLKTVLGTTFDPLDLMAYFIGAALIIFTEKYIYNAPN